MEFKNFDINKIKNPPAADELNEVNSIKFKLLIKIINEIFEIEKKYKKLKEKSSIDRNINNIKENLKNLFEDCSGLEVHNPINEKYDHTRYDCEAKIAGSATENLIIIDVIKPLIRLNNKKNIKIVQKAVVIVKGASDE